MKALKILSNILLIGNPVCGFFIFACLFGGGWHLLLIPFLICAIVLNLKLHFYTHKEEHAKYEAWRKEFEKEWEYLGLTDDHYQDEVWRNRLTGEIKEI